jgi:hypothetical protein
MDLLTSVRLAFYRPTVWTVDLTPPEPWDELYLTLKDIAASVQTLGHGLLAAFQQFGKQMQTTASTSIDPAINDAIEAITKADFEQKMAGVDYLLVVVDEMQEWDEKRNGTYRITSAKPEIKLPIRKTNSGPPRVPFTKRGRK